MEKVARGYACEESSSRTGRCSSGRTTPGYISFEQFLASQQHIRENIAMPEGDTASHAGTVREGLAARQ
jgi:hypothetical protein